MQRGTFSLFALSWKFPDFTLTASSPSRNFTRVLALNFPHLLNVLRKALKFCIKYNKFKTNS